MTKVMFPRRTKHAFIPESDIESLYDDAGAGTTQQAAVTTVDGRPPAPVAKTIIHSTGTSGAELANEVRATYRALGLDLLGGGTFDLAQPRREGAWLKPRQDVSFRDTEDLYLYDANGRILEDARNVMGEKAYAEHIQGALITDRSLTGHGGQADQRIALLAAIARRPELTRWAEGPLLRLLPAPRRESGMAYWQETKPETVQVTDITCAGTAGAVGGSSVLQVVAIKRLAAERLGITLHQRIVLLGARLWGWPDAPVHDRIGENERLFLRQLDEAMTTKKVTIGTESVTFSTPLVDYGNVIVFNPSLGDPITKTVSEEVRARYIVAAARELAIAEASHALHKTRDIEVNATPNSYIRTIRFVGHALNRGALADELARRKATRLRQALLDRITGHPTGQAA